MITGLRISNFKCFSALDLDLRPLTVVTGVNGTGKSTLLQGLLLARQAVQDSSSPVVQLNGPYGLTLGEAAEVLNPNADPPEIEIAIAESGSWHRYVFDVPNDRALNLPIKTRPESAPTSLTGRGAEFSYLNAERLGPRDQLDVTAEEKGLVGVGVRGEFTAQALAMHETDEVRPPLRHPETETTGRGVTTLRTQVEMWASSIIRPIKITAQWPAGIAASLIRFQEPELIRQQMLSELIRPANMGFGFSYALPILVAGLLMPESGLLIVENPEAHLHPAGQSKLGAFLARVAGSGAQVIVETHSDHVVNGIRLAAVEDRVIDPSAVIFHFFGDEPGLAPAAIELNERGALSEWPKGFFDQIEEDLGRITRAKRRNA
jgi:predicted ATPase